MDRVLLMIIAGMKALLGITPYRTLSGKMMWPSL
jgi:hypothetical protein